jgi:hypothetical protein
MCKIRYIIREQDKQHKTEQERTQPTNSNIYEHRQDIYIYQHKQQQKTAVFLPKILTPDDGHIVRNM